ncbi:MAG: HEAT repeat domain-containing protein [Planctomycetia bacterium]
MSKIALVLSLLALAAGVLGLLRRNEPASTAVSVALSSAEVDKVARQLAEEVQRSAAARDQAAQRELDQRLKRLQELLASATEGLQQAQSRVQATSDLSAGKLEELEAVLTTLSGGLDRETKALAALESRVKSVEERPVAAAAAAPAAAPKPGPNPSAPKATLPGMPKPELPNVQEDPAVAKALVEKALADLDSDQPETIYPAITVVARRQVLAAVPKLVKILAGHEDYLMRQAAASALGDLRACDAVLALADALKDKTQMVAQQAGKSLRLITEHDLGLSPQARPAERTKARGDMLEWWSRHEAEVRERLKQAKAP